MEKDKYEKSTTEVKHHASYLPRLSLAERNRRWVRIRELMAIEGLKCLLIIGNDSHWDMGMANMRYVTHIASKPDAFAVFQFEGDPIVWTKLPYFHIPYGSRYLYTQDWVNDIRPNTGVAPIIDFLKSQGYHREKIGLIGMRSAITTDIIPMSIYNYIQKALPDAKIIDSTSLIEYLRMIKSPEEITMLEKASELARKTIDTLIDSAEPGKKECEVYADMVHTQITNGGEAQIFLFMSSGPVEGMGEKYLLHGAEQPAVPTMRTLEVGDLIITEFHANWGGYLSAAEFSLYLGKAPDEIRKIHDVCVLCLETVIEKMKPGVTFREVLEAEREPCQRMGMDFIELGFHGHGLASPEIPTAVTSAGSPWGAGEGILSLEVRENMVFGTNIDIYDPKWKKDVGLMLGDTLCVTKSGVRRLINTPLNILDKG